MGNLSDIEKKVEKERLAALGLWNRFKLEATDMLEDARFYLSEHRKGLVVGFTLSVFALALVAFVVNLF